ncbi:thiamine pyrophosphate-dependent enzyme [Cronobacter sakazakii]|uniref:thiamine pyrophosphate-dependent enzyme n=1 Tax=Cronobacter sakazakii TaxID=28141 RepID=UPI000976B3F2|nr:thiamine pyrophosphate-dependent enzyme [Cronobacter sakazakii]
MTKKTSDFFVERLKAWGVTRIYGYPGDGINGVLGALQRADKAGDGIEFIQVRHEEMAAFMACAHAKFTGEPGVCLSTGGPGATHLLTGLYDAQMDHMPVTLLMIGTGFPWTEFLPKEGQARAVQIDIDASMLGLRYPTEVNLHGDAVSTLQALLPLLKRKEDRSWQEKIAVSVKAWWEKMEERAMAKATPVNPQRVVWEMSPLLPDNAIVTSDSGSCANWFARDYRVKQGQRASLSGGLACMGAAVPYAIAAKFAFPEKPVVALVGDGAMQMNNLAELITIQKYWQRWSDPRLIVCVFNNQDLNQVTWEQRIMEGNPRFAATQDVPDVPYAQFAESIGLKGIYVDSPEELQAAWQQALAADRPVVLEVKTDPEVAPLPPHISFAQAKGFMSSMAKGDKSAGKVIADTAHQVMNTVLPGKK